MKSDNRIDFLNRLENLVKVFSLFVTLTNHLVIPKGPKMSLRVTSSQDEPVNRSIR